MTSTDRSTIINGPSKWDFVLSLTDGEYQRQRLVVFELEAGYGRPPLSVNVAINGIERENESDESWLFSGVSLCPISSEKIKGHFSTKTRKGWMEFVSP